MIKKPISEIDFTFFDTETTGLSPQGGDRIIELAGIRLRGGRRLGEFNSLVNPRRPVSAGAFSVNHISDEMLRPAPFIEDVLPGFLKFSGGSCLCSYNAPFDIGFLENEMVLAGVDPACISGTGVVDVLKMARRLLPDLPRHALWFVAESLGVRRAQEHRAFSDVELTISVFDKLNDILTAEGITGYSQLVSLFAVSGAHLESSLAQRCSQIQEAIDAHAGLLIRYLPSRGGGVTQRRVIPHEIRRERGGSFLVAQCLLRNQERTFRIDGILQLEVV